MGQNYSFRTPPKSSSPISHPTSRSSVDAALAEGIAILRELEIVAFQLSRNSTAGLFFAQQKLVLLRLANGKPPTRDELVRLAARVPLGSQANYRKALHE